MPLNESVLSVEILLNKHFYGIIPAYPNRVELNDLPFCNYYIIHPHLSIKITTSIIQLITEYLGIIKGLVTLLSGYSAIARQK